MQLAYSILSACSIFVTVGWKDYPNIQLPPARAMTAVGNGPPYSHSRGLSMPSMIEMSATRCSTRRTITCGVE